MNVQQLIQQDRDIKADAIPNPFKAALAVLENQCYSGQGRSVVRILTVDNVSVVMPDGMVLISGMVLMRDYYITSPCEYAVLVGPCYDGPVI